jgi:hypothetical protein
MTLRDALLVDWRRITEDRQVGRLLAVPWRPGTNGTRRHPPA